MQFNNQKTRNVADAVAKILAGESAKQEPKMLEEELKGQQHKIDKNKNNKIDAHDFAILRGEKKTPVKEENGASKPEENKFHGKLDKLVHKTFGKSKEEMKKEEVQQVDEASYSAKAARAGKDIGKPGKAFSMIAKKAGERYGSEEKGKAVAGAILKKLRMKEDEDLEITDEQMEELLESYEYDQENQMTFSEMLAAYKEHGLAVIAEEPTEDEFNAEIKKAQAKSEGKEKADVAKAAVQAVKQEEIEVLDANIVNGVEQVDIEERTLTEPEAKKKEEIVKSMKKKMSGFKERYGERAKNVMYATATKMAKKD